MPLHRTAEAVRHYDKKRHELLSLMDTGRLTEQLEEMEAALLAVKEAFAADTADVNSKENAMLVHPDNNNGWLRRMLYDEGFTDCALTDEQRRQRGWGW